MRVQSTTCGCFAVASAALVAIGHSKLLGDPDTYWHIAVGRDMLATGRVPTTDQYSYTFEGAPWFANQWLSECVLALLDRWTGFDGVLAAAVSLVAGAFALIGANCFQQGWRLLPTACLLTLVFGASAYNLVARPHLITLFLMPVMGAWLSNVESGKWSVRSLGALPVVSALWANLHGGVLGGLATVGLVFGGWIVVAWRGGRTPLRSRGDVALLAVCLIGSAGALCVNPYGPRMFEAWRAILSMDLPNLVIEHARLDPRRPEGWFVILLGLVYGVALGSTPWRSWRITWLAPLVWLALALTRIRHAPLFAGLAGVALAEIATHSAWRERLTRRGWLSAEPPRLERSLRWTWVLFGGPVAALLCAGAWHAGHPQSSLVARPLPRIWPAEILPALDGLPEPGDRPRRIFNDQLYGGFLIYHFPKGRVFIDGRCELHGEPRLRDYLAAQRDPSIIDAWLDAAPPDAAVVRNETPFDRYFANRSAWELVERSSRAALYARRDSEPSLGQPRAAP